MFVRSEKKKVDLKNLTNEPIRSVREVHDERLQLYGVESEFKEPEDEEPSRDNRSNLGHGRSRCRSWVSPIGANKLRG